MEQLNTPDSDYHDLSPKGSVDQPIRTLIRDINGIEGLVTTSSCSGRISVFLEGKRSDAGPTEPDQEATIAGPGGKGGGGSWLYISHDAVPVPLPDKASASHYLSTFQMKARDLSENAPGISARYIHLKFEPMVRRPSHDQTILTDEEQILHILTASMEDSQRVLTSALGGGFRESGAVSLSPSKTGEINPIVAVRSTGYSFDSIIGYQNENGDNVALVDESYLQILVAIANERFNINTERIGRFQNALLEQYTQLLNPTPTSAKPGWEDAETRKQRKREEGLARQKALRVEKEASSTGVTQDNESGEILNLTNNISI